MTPAPNGHKPDPKTDRAGPLPWSAYARYSDRKQDRSVEQQVAAFHAYAASHQIALPDPFIFADEAKSGKSDVSRDDLLNLMQLLERRPRPVAGVLLWASSRLSRNMDDSDWYKATIRRAGYQIIFVGEPMLQSIPGLEGRFMEDVTEYLDAKFRETLARDVVRGMYDELELGNIVSKAPRGYRVGVVDGKRKFVIDPQHAPAVRRAWEMRAAGYAVRDIHEATRLYANHQAYSEMFRNRLYLGLMAWRGREYAGFCEPLITPATWAAVTAVNEARIHPRRVRSAYLLSGLVYCDDGHKMYGQSNVTRGGVHYAYYRCRWELQKGLCNHIRSNLLEGHVIEQAQAEFTVARLGPAYRAWLKRRGKQTDRAGRAVEGLKLKLLTANRAIDNILAAIEGREQAPRSLVDQLSEREAERDKIRNQLLAAPLPAAAKEFDLKDYCAGIQARLASDDLAERRLALRTVVEKVTVGHGRTISDVEILFHRLPE